MAKKERKDQPQPPEDAGHDGEDARRLRPVDKKIPEPRKNLRQRQAWFRKRAGC